jgi:hypothetical protein
VSGAERFTRDVNVGLSSRKGVQLVGKKKKAKPMKGTNKETKDKKTITHPND